MMADYVEEDTSCDWAEATSNRKRVFCKFCGIFLTYRPSLLRRHAKTEKHVKASIMIMEGKAEVRNQENAIPSDPRRSKSSKKLLNFKRKKPTNIHKPPHQENAQPHAYVQDISFQSAAKRQRREYILSTSDELREFSVAVPHVPSRHLIGPFINNAVHNYDDGGDDLNYLFGLCVGAGLKKCSEEQASLARLKIQIIMHQAFVDELSLLERKE